MRCTRWRGRGDFLTARCSKKFRLELYIKNTIIFNSVLYMQLTKAARPRGSGPRTDSGGEGSERRGRACFLTCGPLGSRTMPRSTSFRRVVQKQNNLISILYKSAFSPSLNFVRKNIDSRVKMWYNCRRANKKPFKRWHS